MKIMQICYEDSDNAMAEIALSEMEGCDYPLTITSIKDVTSLTKKEALVLKELLKDLE